MTARLALLAGLAALAMSVPARAQMFGPASNPAAGPQPIQAPGQTSNQASSQTPGQEVDPWAGLRPASEGAPSLAPSTTPAAPQRAVAASVPLPPRRPPVPAAPPATTPATADVAAGISPPAAGTPLPRAPLPPARPDEARQAQVAATLGAPSVPAPATPGPAPQITPSGVRPGPDDTAKPAAQAPAAAEPPAEAPPPHAAPAREAAATPVEGDGHDNPARPTDAGTAASAQGQAGSAQAAEVRSVAPTADAPEAHVSEAHSPSPAAPSPPGDPHGGAQSHGPEAGTADASTGTAQTNAPVAGGANGGDAHGNGTHTNGADTGSASGGGAHPAPDSGAHASTPPALEPSPSREPVELVRRLQRLQDRIAQGEVDGIARQRTLIAQMDQAFAAADPAMWQAPANARALVNYFLSGGTPAVLRAIVMREPRPAIDEKLLLGTLFYIEGREDSALKELGEVDARKLPNTIGGQVALAQAALVVRNDPQKAAQLLALARLLLPGTLVEEAALRRQILVAAQASDTAGFERLAGDYLFRFRHSAYAGNFRQRFAAALTRMSFLAEPDGLARLDALLKPMEEEARRELYLQLARAALVDGKTQLAADCAKRASDLSPPASQDAERAQVYLGAAQAVTADQFQSATAALKKVDRDRLDPSDAALMDAALNAADTVRLADQPAAAGRRAPTTVKKVGLPPEEPKPSPILSKARDALKQVDGLLKDAPR